MAWNPEIGSSRIGGFVTEELGRIPTAGDATTWKGYRIGVLRADERRARLVHLSKE